MEHHRSARTLTSNTREPGSPGKATGRRSDDPAGDRRVRHRGVRQLGLRPLLGGQGGVQRAVGVRLPELRRGRHLRRPRRLSRLPPGTSTNGRAVMPSSPRRLSGLPLDLGHRLDCRMGPSPGRERSPEKGRPPVSPPGGDCASGFADGERLPPSRRRTPAARLSWRQCDACGKWRSLPASSEETSSPAGRWSCATFSGAGPGLRCSLAPAPLPLLGIATRTLRRGTTRATSRRSET